MKNLLENLSRRINMWMYGRYGYDELNMLIAITIFACLILSAFIRPFYGLALFLMIYSMYRICSKNLGARQKELNTYLQIKLKIKQQMNIKRDKFRYRKTHKYYKCPDCKAYLRVPKGKGKIEISCKKCGHKFIKKT